MFTWGHWQVIKSATDEQDIYSWRTKASLLTPNIEQIILEKDSCLTKLPLNYYFYISRSDFK